MSESRRGGRADPGGDVTTDLVEYLILAVPELDSLVTVVPALAGLVEVGAIRVLDMVALVRDRDGTPAVLEVDAVASLSALAGVEGEFGGLLSDSDIGFASLAIEPGTAGLVLVTEDRWAEPLAVAAKQAGGQIVGGERILASRLVAALSSLSDEQDEEL